MIYCNKTSLMHNCCWATDNQILNRVIVTHNEGKTIFENGMVSAYTREVHNKTISLWDYGFTYNGIHYKSTTPQSNAEATISYPIVSELLDMQLITKTSSHKVHFDDNDVSHVYARYFHTMYQYTLEYFTHYDEIYVVERSLEHVRTHPSPYRVINKRHETDDKEYLLFGTPDFDNKEDHIFQLSLVCNVNFDAYSRVLPIMNDFAKVVNMQDYPNHPSDLVLRRCK